MTSPIVKKIKVAYKHSHYKPKNAGHNYCSPRLPWIQMKGKWLAKAGFNIDTAIRVEVSEGRLVLTAE